MHNKKCRKRGFTLIELLVVVLIIGILAAVALPQYQKSVQKARLSQLDAIVDAGKKNIELYVLENGRPSGEDAAALTGTNSESTYDMPGDCTQDENKCIVGDWEVMVTVGSEDVGVQAVWMGGGIFPEGMGVQVTRHNGSSVWFVNFRFPNAAVCQWAKGRGFPGYADAVAACAREGVTLEAYGG